MSVIGKGVTLRGFHFEDWILTFNLAAGITASDAGKAVALDTSAANTAKLAGDGDEIMGRLESVENRIQEGVLAGAVALKFANLVPIKTGEVVAIGNSVQGAGAGEVKAVAAAAGVHTTHDRKNFVTEVSGDYAVVVQL